MAKKSTEFTLEITEFRLFEFLLTHIGGESGEDAKELKSQQGFIFRFKRFYVIDKTKGGEDWMWKITMSGDGESEEIKINSADAPKRCWVMAVTLEAISQDRKILQRLAGRVLHVLPASRDSPSAEGKLQNITRFNETSKPSFATTSMDRLVGEEVENAGEIPLEFMTMGFDVKFESVEQ